MKKLVFASSNPGKIRELNALLKPLDISVIPQTDLNVTDREETGLSFVENAILKARHACTMTGLPAIADDSGLEIAALNGAPGIYSARYANKKGDAKANIEKVLTEMHSVREEHRDAAFHCTLVLMTSPTDPTPLICEGRWHGVILTTPTGEDGFGYDPIFFDKKLQKSAAQLPLDIKNQISHRGQAMRLLLQKLPEKLC